MTLGHMRFKLKPENNTFETICINYYKNILGESLQINKTPNIYQT